MGINSEIELEKPDTQQQENFVLLNTPVPQCAINRKFNFVAASESFKDHFISTPNHLSQILEKESFERFVAFIGKRTKGNLKLMFKAGAELILYQTYIQEQDGLFYLMLLEAEETVAKQVKKEQKTIAPLPLHEALICLEELQERTDRLRHEADDRRLYLRQVIDIVPSYIDVRDENGIILMANKPLAEFLKVDIKSLVGKRFTDFIVNKEQGKRMHQKHKSVFQNWESTYYPVEEVHIDYSDRVFYFKEYKIPFVFKGEKAVLTVNTQIDDLIQTEKELESSRQRYKKIFQHSPVGIFNYGADLKIKRCNPKFAEIMSSTIGRILGADLLEELENEDARKTLMNSIDEGEDIFEGWYNSVIANRKAYVKCHFRSLKDFRGQFSGGVAIVEDLTSIIVSRQQQFDSKNLLKTVFNALQDVILVMDNNFDLIMTNLDRSSYKIDSDKPCYERIFNLEHKCSKCKLREVFMTGNSYHWSSYDESTDHYLEVRMTPVKDLSGNVVRVVEHIQDITEHKRTERKLEAAKIKAEESEKLKTAFLQNISHEIRTPMNSIIGFGELIQDKNITVDQRIQYGQIITSNTKWLLNVMEQIMILSKIESSQLTLSTERLNFNSTLKNLQTTAQHMNIEQGKNLKIITHFPISDNLAYFRTDYVLFQSMLEALVDNAVKFTDSGVVELGYETNFESYISFYVKDTGKGIPEEFKNSVFLAFHQVEDSDYTRGGNGLGLAIAKGIAENLGGDISYCSTVGQGSKFVVKFPFSFMND